jgi:hypothetical protein
VGKIENKSILSKYYKKVNDYFAFLEKGICNKRLSKPFI